MVEEELRRAFGPLIAALSSQGAERAIRRNNLSFADLFLPFSEVQCSLKDPNGTAISSRLVLDIRDLRHDGFLLSLTVLPSVLQEAVQSAASNSDAERVVSVFTETLLQWAEPAEHEMLRTYVACIFAVSTEDEDPMGELQKLLELQHNQQHGDVSRSSVGPAHCVLPKWMLPNTFKYYVLVSDSSAVDEARANEAFSLMCKAYGQVNCFLLRINSGSGSGDLPDPWFGCIERKYRGLESGLAVARRNLLTKSTTALATSSSVRSLDGTVVSRAPDRLTEDNYFGHWSTFADYLEDGTPTQSARAPLAYGQFLDEGDRERIARMMREMTVNALVPFVERQLRILAEQIANRRGLSKSLTTGMRKWFSSATAQSSVTTPITYPAESSEMQIRRFADMSFVFGLFAIANHHYQIIRKEFSVDQAWIYHAGTLEMTAFCTYLTGPQAFSKSAAWRPLEVALAAYATASPILAMRVALLCSSILSTLGLFIEAAAQLRKAAVDIENDLFRGILYQKTASCYGGANKVRLMAFYAFQAGLRLMKAGQRTFGLDCHRRALAEISGKQYTPTEGFILCELARYSENKPTALSFCEVLLKGGFDDVGPEIQGEIFCRYLSLLSSTKGDAVGGASVFVPLVDRQSVRVIHGRYPKEFVGPSTPEECSAWRELQRIAHQSFDPLQQVQPVVLTSCQYTDNSKVCTTPAYEPFRVIVGLKNPLAIKLTMRNVRLVADCTGMILDPCVLDEVVLKPASGFTDVELRLVPGSKLKFLRVKGIAFNLVWNELSVACEIPFKVESFDFENDHRLEMCITDTSWPVLEVDFSQMHVLNAFCGQVLVFDCEVFVKLIRISAFCIVTDYADRISVSEPFVTPWTSKNTWCKANAQFSSAGQRLIVFRPTNEHFELSLAEKKSIRIAMCAPADEVTNCRVLLLVLFQGTNGMHREQHHVVVVNTRRLLNLSLSYGDRSERNCILKAQNLLSARDSVLAKIELLRIKLRESQSSVTGSPDVAATLLSIHPVRNRRVELECEQSDNFGIYFTTAEQKCDQRDLFWMGDELNDLPKWPVLPRSSTTSARVRQFGILWKANIVNTDGTISNVFGEQFVPLSGEDVGGVVGSGCSDGSLNALFCSISTTSTVILHNFHDNKLCEIPVKILIKNDDALRRSAEVTLKWTGQVEDASLLELTQMLSDVTQASAASSLYSFPPASLGTQPILCTVRDELAARISPGESHEFLFTLLVTAPSVFEITCFDGQALLDGGASVAVIIPPLQVTVWNSGE